MTLSGSERNAPCPCGSGRKTKKCCGATTVSSNDRAGQTSLLSFAQALTLQQNGKSAEAEFAYRRIIESQKNAAGALRQLGILCHQTGRSAEGASYLQQALQLNTKDVQAAVTLGDILRDLGHLENAIGCYQHALDLTPHEPLIHANLGFALLRNGMAAEALKHLTMAHKRLPQLQELLLYCGEAEEQLQNYSAAIDCYRKFLALQPQHPTARLNLADCLKNTGSTAEAIASYQELLLAHPEFIPASNNLGNLFRAEGRLDEAERVFRRAIEQSPNLPELRNNLGAVLISQNRLEEAMAELARVLDRDPKSATAINNSSVALLTANQPDQAIQQLSAGIAGNSMDAELHYHRGLAYLLQGKLAEGFADYEWRWQTHLYKAPRDRLCYPAWTGDQLQGRTLLVHAEQGLGDTIQFCRYLPKLRELAGSNGKIVFECQPELIELLSSLQGIDSLVARSPTIPNADVQIPLLSLPKLFGTTLSSIPADIPYLLPDQEHVQKWTALQATQVPQAGQRKRIGIVWAGNKAHSNDRFRSATPEIFADLAHSPAFQLISLQRERSPEQIRAEDELGITNISAALLNFADTAAALNELDLLITVDTSVAHLAGALGKPVWVLLAHSPDWRWMLHRADSPWYPTVRLFRQTSPGDWQGISAQIHTALLEP